MSVITPGAPPQTLQGLVGKTVSEPSHPSKALAAVLVGAACICLQSFMFVLLLFSSSESRRGCEARATTPCGFQFSHKALTFPSRDERGGRSHRSASCSAEVSLLSSLRSGGEVNSVGLAGDSLMRCLS